MTKIEFKETQKFRQLWVWLIIIVPVVIAALLIFMGSPSRKEISESNPQTVTILTLSILFTLAPIVLFWFIRLETKINAKEMYMQFFPFVKKHILWENVKTVKVVNYGFVGGWDIRLWTRQGVSIEMKNGKKFLVGTRKVAKLQEVIEKISNESPSLL